jgi:hypothetical protein
MKLLTLITAILLHTYTSGLCQEVRIYHGANGGTSILRPWDNIGSFGSTDSAEEIIKPLHSTIDLVVMNANPFLYSYEIKLENLELTDETPDMSILLAALNILYPVAASPGVGPAMAHPAKKSAFEKYSDNVGSLREDLIAAQSAIQQSDAPEELLDVFNHANKGFNLAKKTILNLDASPGRFNSPTLKEDLDKMLASAIDANSELLEGTDDGNLKIEYYKLINAQLTDAVKKIKELAKSDGVIRFHVTVTDKPQSIRLIIKKKEALPSLSRDEYDKIIGVLTPKFKRPVLEIVPTACMAYASDIPEYSIKDNVIAERRTDNFSFKAGAMLLFNLVNFGKYGEGAWGIGLGYNIPKENVLESFYLGTLFSYKNLFRVGGGVGFSEFPTGLNDGAKVGDPLPSEIKNISDVVKYEKRPAFFITFSISGLTILSK